MKHKIIKIRNVSQKTPIVQNADKNKKIGEKNEFSTV